MPFHPEFQITQALDQCKDLLIRHADMLPQPGLRSAMKPGTALKNG